MDTLVVQIKDSKRKRFLLQLLAELDFVEIKPFASHLTADERRFITSIRSGLGEISQHQKGKIQLKTAQELISEL